MDETTANMQRISMNLTKVEFSGFCKGMSLQWMFRALDGTTKNNRATKKFNFWDAAYDRYSHNCKD